MPNESAHANPDQRRKLMEFLDWIICIRSPTVALRRAIRLSEKGKAAEAFRLLTRAAKAGIADAEYRVAQSYLAGSGVPPSRVEGARWLQRAAAHGLVEAQLMLSTLCINGLIRVPSGDASDSGFRAESLFAEDTPTDPNFDVALTWSRQAAQAGSAQGQALLAYVLTNGPESMRDLEEAQRWYKQSASAGCPEGCLGYALSLARQSTDDETLGRIAGLLRQAAKAEIPTAIYLLGVLTEQGQGQSVILSSQSNSFATQPNVDTARRKSGGGLPSLKVGTLRKTLRQVNPGCAAPRWPEIQRRRHLSVTFTLRTALCHRTTLRPRSGIDALRKRGISRRPARWECFTSLAPGSRRIKMRLRAGCVLPQRRAIEVHG